MTHFPRLLWRCSLLGCCAAVLAEAPPNRPRSSPAHRDVTPAPSETKTFTVAPELKLVAQFDQDGDQRLNKTERQNARAYLAQHPEPVPPPNPTRNAEEEPAALEPARTGEKLTPAQVTAFAGRPLYDPATLRTVFLEFSDSDWETELADFARTDVLVPARLTVDGQVFEEVGIHFQPAPATAPLPAGYKRTFSIALDFADKEQRLGGERLLQLEDARTDPTLARSTLYRHIAREFIAMPAANFVRVVINGELWGIYVSTQPFDESFTQEKFGSAAGARWLAVAQGNLAYLGEDPAPYRERYRLLSSDDPAAWTRLIQLCRTLDQTPLDQLEAALKPQLDVDGAIKFLALETALMNQTGYTSDGRGYGLYLDPKGRFHLVPLATETSFRLIPGHEYVSGRIGPSGPSGPDRHEAPPPRNTSVPAAPPEIPVPKAASPNGTPSDFPRQRATDLAMLLSYSFVNKIDRNDDQKLTRAEWMDFARAWFLVIDENFAGEVTREQFTTSVRTLVSPPSMRNPRVKQTFSGDDAASLIAGDLWHGMTHKSDGRVTRDEFIAAFAAWFTAWSDPKTAQLTQPILQRTFGSLFSQSVFQADQLYVAPHPLPSKQEPEVRGERGGRGGGRDGSGFNVGGGLAVLGSVVGLPGGGGPGSRGGSGRERTLETYYAPLDPLAPLLDPENVLFSKLFAAPSLRARYLSCVREIADHWLTWQRLGPLAKAAQALVADDVKRETHSTTGYIRFVQDLDQDTGSSSSRKRDSTVAPNLKAFIEERRVYLQSHTLPND